MDWREGGGCWALVSQPHWLPLASFLSERPGVRALKPPSRDLLPMPPSHPLCVSDPHPAPPPAQFCTAWFWAAGVWVAELGRKRGKGGIRVLGVHLATHACPRSMCLVQLTCSGTGDPTPTPEGTGECSSNSRRQLRTGAQSSSHLRANPHPSLTDRMQLQRAGDQQEALGWPPGSRCLILLPVVSSPLILVPEASLLCLSITHSVNQSPICNPTHSHHSPSLVTATSLVPHPLSLCLPTTSMLLVISSYPAFYPHTPSSHLTPHCPFSLPLTQVLRENPAGEVHNGAHR